MTYKILLVFLSVTYVLVYSFTADNKFNNATFTAHHNRYSLYVWKLGFDNTVEGCNEKQFLKWKHGDPSCFTHNWWTETARRHLWSTCNLSGREVSAIYLSDVVSHLKKSWLRGNCNTTQIDVIRQTVQEGHALVPGLKVYALTSISDRDVSEQYMVKYVKWYNEKCIGSAIEKFDGISINNEVYTRIKCNCNKEKQRYLDKLQVAYNEAKGRGEPLLTHFSIGWNWGLCNGEPDRFYWNGSRKSGALHMIDIFDSVDVQVAATQYPQVTKRAVLAGYRYAVKLGKPFFIEVYTGKNNQCQTTFFPRKCGHQTHSEAEMFNIFDQFQFKGIDQARPCIHAYRSIYSSGGHPLWPAHR